MIHVSSDGEYLHHGQWKKSGASGLPPVEEARRGTIAHSILSAHNRSGSEENLAIVFDALTSHDITFVGIIQTARASGMQSFPVPYYLTNCHNSLCAVGGTINEDDHLFGLSSAMRYGGEYVPAHLAVIHQYMREMAAGCGKMILGSDSHTRYGALGTMAVGEGGPELVKQLVGRTYDIARPEVVAVWLEGAPRPGVGPQDVALALIGAVFKKGLVKNRVLEFIGPGVSALSVDYRMGVDVMTTETTCLTSIWRTDDKVRDYLAVHGRPGDYKPLAPADTAWYDLVIRIDLSTVEPMIALPFHPSNAYPISVFKENAADLLAQVEREADAMLPEKFPRPRLMDKLHGGQFYVDQAVVAGCSGGTFENLTRVAAILKGRDVGSGAFGLSAYPASQPQYLELIRTGAVSTLMEAGATLRTAFCGPCFGAGDVPANNAFSIRHTTRNFPSREGSKPGEGQISYVALMDARSIAATAANGGRLTAATELDGLAPEGDIPYRFDPAIYQKRVYHGWGRPDPGTQVIFGPNITEWPAMPSLPENLLLDVASAIYDPVTTTDELIPSGETSSLRSNPLRLAEFTLSRKDPGYVGRAKASLAQEVARRADPKAAADTFAAAGLAGREADTGLGSVLFARKPGDGSAREQAASSQKVLGGWANIAGEYATKRYRSNLVNWGLLPFVMDGFETSGIEVGDRVYIPDVRKILAAGADTFRAVLIRGASRHDLTLRLPDMTRDERDIILAGCLMNYYSKK